MSRKLNYQDYEGSMAKSQLMKIENYARKLNEMIHPEDELEAWVQSKLSVIDAYMGDIKHYLDYELKEMGEGGTFEDVEDDDKGKFVSMMEEAKEYVGEELWNEYDEDEKIAVTKYLKQKARIGYAEGGVIKTEKFEIIPSNYKGLGRYYVKIPNTTYYGMLKFFKDGTFHTIDWYEEYDEETEEYTSNEPPYSEYIDEWLDENIDEFIKIANENK